MGKEKMTESSKGISSYGSIYALGHIAVADILNGEDVEITEKVDGSQISFGVIDGELMIRSKNQRLHIGADNGMFNTAVLKITELQHAFTPGYVYRGEFFSKPKHNTLAYDRVPKNNIMIYDIERTMGSSDFLRRKDRTKETLRIGFEPVRVFFTGPGCTLDWIKGYLEEYSVLSGVKIEGVVVKNYSLFTEDKKVAKAKFVSAEFKEKNDKEWKKENPTQKDIIAQLVETYAVPARWQKAVQHLRDDGKLEGSPRDIGNLIKEAQIDLKKEESEAIKEFLFNHFIGQITRGSIAGLPQWYKEQIAKGNING
jgi:hypothetical protein